MDPAEIRSAHFVDAYFPVVDGVAQTVHHYAKQMNRLAGSCVVAPEPLSRDYDDSGLGYDVFRTAAVRVPIAEYTLPAPRFDPRLRGWLSKKKPAVIHFHSPFFEGSFAASYAKKRGVPSVATFHSKYYDDAINVTGSKTVAKLVTAKVVRCFQSADSVWAVSHGAADTLRSYGFKGNIDVIENGTSFEPPKDPDALRVRAAAAFSIPRDKKILLFVGHLIWHKNLKLVLDTFRMLCDRCGDYRLLIVGDGYDENEIKSYARSLCFPDEAVRFLGKILDRELLAGVYLNADLFFFPSVYDTSGLVIREAAAMGTPSLLVEGSDAAEAVQQNVSGFLTAESADAMCREILRVFRTEGLLKKVGAQAQISIPKPWKTMVAAAMEKYAEIIERYRFEHQND